MSPDVVVVGGGAIGLGCAWRLVQRGVRVEVVDPEPGAGASGVAAGMLAPVTEARLGEEALLRLGLASLGRWGAFAAEIAQATELGAGISFRADGTVLVALDADDRALLRESVDRQRELGLDVQELPARELRSLEPALAPGVRRGVLAAEERAVDPAALVRALVAAVELAGVVLRRDEVRRLVTEPATPAGSRVGTGWRATTSDTGMGAEGEASRGGRVVGVELAGGERISAGTVVLAAGAWAGEIPGLPEGVRVPVRPVKGQVVTLRQRADDIVVHHTVRGLVQGSDVYVVPRDDGRVVCGATMEERGWDRTVTAGGAYELLRDVLALFPGLDEAELMEVRAGFRPGTPDDLPLIGAGPLDGLVMATGHYRNGILLTPITADAVAATVTGGPVPDEVAPCRPGRFSERDAAPATSSARPGRAARVTT